MITYLTATWILTVTVVFVIIFGAWMNADDETGKRKRKAQRMAATTTLKCIITAITAPVAVWLWAVYLVYKLFQMATKSEDKP